MKKDEDFSYETWLDDGGRLDSRMTTRPRRFRLGKWIQQQAPWLPQLLLRWERLWFQIRIK